MSPVKTVMQVKWYVKLFIYLADTSGDLLIFFVINEILGCFWPANEFMRNRAFNLWSASAAHQASLRMLEP